MRPGLGLQYKFPLGKNAWLTFLTFDLFDLKAILDALLAASAAKILLS